MISQDKNKINIKELALKAKKNDKSFLYYDNSKSKINSIIRKNSLPKYVLNYLWQSKIYKKEIVKHQELSEEIRVDIIKECVNNYPDSPWVSVLKNFLKSHNPKDGELKTLIESGNNTIVVECWDSKTINCFRINKQSELFEIIKNRTQYGNEYISKRITSIVINIFKDVPEMQISILDTILGIKNNFIIRNILEPVFRSTKINDDIVDHLLTNADVEAFKDIVRVAIHRNNINENMIAKIYLAIG